MSDDLVRFRFEVPRERIAAIAGPVLDRLRDFVHNDDTPGAYWEWFDDFKRDLTTIKGEMGQSQVTALQALAMGFDVEAVLDMLGAPKDPS